MGGIGQRLARTLFGRERWEVRTNAQRRGTNARFVIDAVDGNVLEAFWLPR